jgi:hypothetical protein
MFFHTEWFKLVFLILKDTKNKVLFVSLMQDIIVCTVVKKVLKIFIY